MDETNTLETGFSLTTKRDPRPGDASDDSAPAEPNPNKQRSLELALAVARAADTKKAEDIAILDVSRTLGITDYFVICTARSKKQVYVVAEACELAAKKLGMRLRPLEGQESGWVVGDFLDVIVHVFDEQMRGFYDLEHLWADAPRVEFTPEPEAPRAPRATSLPEA